MQSTQPAQATAPTKPTSHRSPRIWPVLRHDPIPLPFIQPANRPSITSLLVGGAGLIGIVLSFFLFNQMGGAATSIGLLALSGVTALASLITFAVQSRQAKRDNANLLRHYTKRLDELTLSENGQQPGEAEKSLWGEIHARRLNDPPLLNPDSADTENFALIPLLLRSSERLWQRQPGDPDFLTVRAGVGPVKPQFAVTVDLPADDLGVPTHDAGFRRQHDRARAAELRYASVKQAPVTIPLREHASLAVIAGPVGNKARDLARSLIGHIALHHSPYEAHVMVAASAQLAGEWQWMRGLARDGSLPRLIAGSGEIWISGIQPLHSELLQREQRLAEATSAREPGTLGPHIIIVIDAIQTDDAWLLTSPAIELALRRGKELGATVVSLHQSLDRAPAQAEVIIDTVTSNMVYSWPDPPAPQALDQIDGASIADCQRILHAFTRFTPPAPQDQTLPAQVNLLDLFTPPIKDPVLYGIEQMWRMMGEASRLAQASNPTAAPSMAIPIGLSATGQVVQLDLMRDGPHGLLIGQTGSGKSELLRSIITSIAMTYSPNEARFVLVDYKGGIELETFAQLPHTLALLTNLDQAGQTIRFLTMLESELAERQERKKRGEVLPHLFVVIDEFAEMVARRGPSDNVDTILESVLRILRLGRALNVHLLFAAQRPEGSVIAKLRGYVQYRICLRTNTEDDSKEVLGRPDAAHLPLTKPGRGYILRGDYELQLFQSARVAQLYQSPGMVDGSEPRPLDVIVAERMKPLIPTYAANIKRWPSSLPTSNVARPTPLILIIRGGFTPVEGAWNVGARPALSKMVAPLGLFDRPAMRQQDWFPVDLLGHAGRLHGGPLAVMGDPNAGKTTTLKTLLLYFALTMTPEKLRWYVLDPTGAFAPFSALPHSHDFLEPGAVNIIDGFDTERFIALKDRLQNAIKQAPGNGRPSILFIVDDYDELGARHKTQLHDLAHLIAQARDKDAYFAMAAARQTYDGLPPTLLSIMATKIFLYMNNRDTLAQLVGGRLPFAPEPSPGRGFAQTRSGMDEIQIAAPVYGTTELDREQNLLALLKERFPNIAF